MYVHRSRQTDEGIGFRGNGDDAANHVHALLQMLLGETVSPITLEECHLTYT
jgi:hypothetical protein